MTYRAKTAIKTVVTLAALLMVGSFENAAHVARSGAGYASGKEVQSNLETKAEPGHDSEIGEPAPDFRSERRSNHLIGEGCQEIVRLHAERHVARDLKFDAATDRD